MFQESIGIGLQMGTRLFINKEFMKVHNFVKANLRGDKPRQLTHLKNNSQVDWFDPVFATRPILFTVVNNCVTQLQQK